MVARIKDLKEGDVFLCPLSSRLSCHKVIRVCNKSLVVSDYEEITEDGYRFRMLNTNTSEHNLQRRISTTYSNNNNLQIYILEKAKL